MLNFTESVFTFLWNLVVKFLTTLLPANQGFPIEITNAFSSFISYLNGLNLIFPISTLLTILSLYLIFESLILIFHFTRFIINLIRGSSA